MDDNYIRELAENQRKEKLRREEENRKKNGKIWNMVRILTIIHLLIHSFTPHFQRETVPLIPYNAEVNVKKLSCCGSECLECRRNYCGYWTEKALVTDLKASLKAEQDSIQGNNLCTILFIALYLLVGFFQATIQEIKIMEKEYENKINEINEKLTIETNKNITLTNNLEYERKLRLEETYKHEVIIEEGRMVQGEKKELINKLYSFQDELIQLRNDAGKLKTSNNVITQAKDTALYQLREYENGIFQVEKANALLRTRLSDLDVENAKLKRQVESLKEKNYQLNQQNISLSHGLGKGNSVKSVTPMSSQTSRMVASSTPFSVKMGLSREDYDNKSMLSSISSLNQFESVQSFMPRTQTTRAPSDTGSVVTSKSSLTLQKIAMMNRK